ncbi:YbhN family protein [Actinomadura sp. HBU206391]|uniref:lysylphosphatidylglycerol synthase transmembrane domain-containing protein n=1 Tax=Actinomadura sp. HBU206391 TaxID=2731692 RepID=UPI00165029FF|nr:lysylphosphatidylglycerol synthase transmembrane domain-containing protein [Actinomadura sp. HBU206391]MBC6456522.1 flippase-like domain-containing protein [Actinomadura sp. HBU206391]
MTTTVRHARTRADRPGGPRTAHRDAYQRHRTGVVAGQPGHRGGVALEERPRLVGERPAAGESLRGEVAPGLAAAAEVAVISADAPAARPALLTRRRLWRLLLTVAAPGVLVIWAIMNAETLGHGIGLLFAGDPYWLAAAGLATAMSWVASAVAQQGSVPARLPFGPLVATQLAGTFANQFSPAGVGAGAVNARFLVRKAVAMPAALTAVAVNVAAGVVVHVVALVLVLAAFPGTLPPLTVPSIARSGVALTVGAVVVVTAVAIALGLPGVRRRVRHACDVALSTGRDGMRELSRRPERLAQLFLGSLAVTACHVLVLYSVLHALGSGIALPAVASAYLLATSAAAFLPSPNGAGGLEAAFGITLIGLGVPGAITVAAVLGYRLMTLWLPLAPAALTFTVLIRRNTL